MIDSDTILDILGNDTRRRILAVLSDEPMYFNQLAKAIEIGQQAVLRHLQALEEGGLIETYTEKSELGAPDRKYYRLNDSFTLTISLSEDDFTITKQKIAKTQQRESMKFYKVLDSMPEEMGEALSLLQASLADINAEMSALEIRVNDLRALKQQILRILHQIGMETFEDDERRVLYKIVEQSPKSMAELSRIMGEKQSHLNDIVTEMTNKIGKEGAQVLFGNLKK
jgi:predicted transcriptional regulator